MPMPFQCPHCGAVTQVADEYIGKSGPCASCGATVTIGTPQKPAPPKVPVNASSSSGVMLALIVVLGVFVCGGLGLAALLLPAVGAARESARRMQCANNLKQIAIAMHNYHDSYRAFPPAYTVDADGNKLHSWRTLILPFIESSHIYDQIDLNAPWDAPQNIRFSQMKIDVYTCPSVDEASPPHTNYQVIVGPGTVFEGAEPIGLHQVLDGSANTVLVVEVPGSTTNWMEPSDLDLEAMQMVINGGVGEMGSNHPGGAQVALADGSVRFLAETIDVGLLRLLITRSDGTPIGAF